MSDRISKIPNSLSTIPKKRKREPNNEINRVAPEKGSGGSANSIKPVKERIDMRQNNIGSENLIMMRGN